VRRKYRFSGLTPYVMEPVGIEVKNYYFTNVTQKRHDGIFISRVTAQGIDKDTSVNFTATKKVIIAK